MFFLLAMFMLSLPFMYSVESHLGLYSSASVTFLFPFNMGQVRMRGDMSNTALVVIVTMMLAI